MNKNEFKKEYLEFKARLYEIDRVLEINVNEFLRVKKNSDFVYIEYKEDELLKDIIDSMEPDELPDMDELHEEYCKYIKHLSSKVHERLDLYDERMKVHDKFEKYMEKNNLIYWDIDEEWCNEAKRYESKWYGWTSNDLIHQAMLLSIFKVDEEEVEEIIENAKKVLELIEGRSYNSGYVSDLEFINKYLRHGEKCDGVEHIFILDCLENDGVWDIYKEPFRRFVQKVIHYIDRDYLDYLKEIEMERAYDDSEK